MSILTRVLRVGEGKRLKELQELAETVNALEPEVEQLSDEEKMAAALELTGLNDIGVSQVDQTWTLQDSLGFMTSVLEGAVRARGLLQAQTEGAREAISEAIRSGMNQYASSDGQYRVPMPAFVGAGTK